MKCCWDGCPPGSLSHLCRGHCQHECWILSDLLHLHTLTLAGFRKRAILQRVWWFNWWFGGVLLTPWLVFAQISSVTCGSCVPFKKMHSVNIFCHRNQVLDTIKTKRVDNLEYQSKGSETWGISWFYFWLMEKNFNHLKCNFTARKKHAQSDNILNAHL